MTMIADAVSGVATLRTLIASAQGLTCGKQGPQRFPRGVIEPRNPTRNRAWRIVLAQPCTLIKAA
jgi:hypothetical protein